MAEPSLSSLREQIADNADYDLGGGVAMAKAFISACRQYLMLVASTSSRTSAGGGGSTTTLDTKAIEKQLALATEWLSVRDPDALAVVAGAQVRSFDFSRFRG